MRRLKPRILGLKAINTSWDSGLLTSHNDFPEGWAVHDKAAVTPVITDTLIELWPLSHEEYCDEWWFFEQIPANFDFTHGFCNWIDNRIANWAELEFDGGAQLAKSIRRFRPEMIVGNNKFTYCVSKCDIGELATKLRFPDDSPNTRA